MSKSLHLIPLIAALAIVLISCSEKNKDTSSAEQPVSGEVRRASDSDTTLAGSYFTKAEQFAKAAQYDSAIAYFEKAGQIYEKLAAQHDEPEVWEKYVECYNHIGDNLREKGEYEKAMAYLNKALEIGLRELDDKSLAVAQSYHNMGGVYLNKGDNDNALKYLQKALAIRLQTLGEVHNDVAASYNGIGVVYINKGDYDNALEYLQKALSIRLQTLGEKHPRVASSYNNIGVIYRKKGDYDNALEYYHKALAIWLEALGKNHPNVAASYNNIGLVYDNKGDYDKSLEYYRKSLAIGLQTLGEKHPDVADNYDNMGDVYENKGDYDKALEYYHKALAIRLRALGEKHADVADSYNNIGIVFQNKSDYDKALEYYHKALAIRLQTLGKKHPDVAISYHSIGNVYNNKGDYDKALEYYQNALSIGLQTLGEKHPNVAANYHNIGDNYDDKGDYDNALKYYHKALAIWLQMLGERHPHIAKSYHNMGNVYIMKSDYENAMEYHRKALSIFLQTWGENHPDVASSYNNIAAVYHDIGDDDNALEYHRKALAIRQQIQGEKHPDVADSYNNIGNIYRGKGDYDSAMVNYHKALSIRFRTLGEKHPRIASSYGNIGYVYREKGNYDNALEYFRRAVSIELQTWGEKHHNVADTYQQMGKVYDKRHYFDQALYYYQKSIIALISDFNDENITVNPVLNNISNEPELLDALTLKAEALANLSRKSGIKDLQLSVSTYALAVELIDKMRSGYKAEGSKLFLAKQAVETYDKAIQTALKLYGLTREEQYTQQAFLFAEKSKSAILQQALSESRAREFAGIPDSLLAKERQLRIDLAFYDRYLTEEKLKRDKSDSVKIADKVFGLKQEYEALLQQLEKNYPEYYNLKYQVNTVSVPEVQEQVLDANTALVEYFTGKDSIFIFTLTKEDFAVTAVAKDSLFEREVEQFRQGIVEPNFARYTQPAHRLYQILLAPVAKKLSAQNLIIIPDGVLSAIPFEALLTKTVSKEGSAEDYPNLPFLLKDYAVSYAYSATLLSETLKKQRAKAKRDYLAFAPVFPDGVPKDTSRTNLVNGNRGLDSFQDKRWGKGSLPASKDEVNGILNLFKGTYGIFDRWFGNKSQVYLEREATVENVKQRDLADYRYVHFATHGLINETHPNLSGLLLASAVLEGPRRAPQTSEQTNTSVKVDTLYLGEVYNLNLNADLVVLSACDTGLGQMAKGEGIIGLTRGFLYAGASNLLVSLWKVDDSRTSEFMLDFYGQMLNDLSKPQALREAKLRMIRRHYEYAKPDFWSPFILIGR